ncbi:uncharacterized protein LOC100397459 isoform X4 [Callithrix jacchus]|uniref:uncharacterized protein LOC100397459 isoform X4 n=1 Tax=Callithrix jacchus TaxID=9483 RepID=UPI00159CFDCD|nr:uncharacterized protein LOC100397459 isoform X4 [Callithrix jacchus]
MWLEPASFPVPSQSPTRGHRTSFLTSVRSGALGPQRDHQLWLGWALLTKKGYQERDLEPQVSIITKLKGVSVTQIKELGNRLWDVADFVKPPQVGALVLLMGVQVLCPLRAWTPAMQPVCVREKHVMPEMAGGGGRGVQEGLHRGVALGQNFQGCVRGFSIEKGTDREARPEKLHFQRLPTEKKLPAAGLSSQCKPSQANLETCLLERECVLCDQLPCDASPSSGQMPRGEFSQEPPSGPLFLCRPQVATHVSLSPSQVAEGSACAWCSPGAGLHLFVNHFVQSSHIPCLVGIPVIPISEVSLCHPGWSAVLQSWLTAASNSQAQAILPPQPPK